MSNSSSSSSQRRLLFSDNNVEEEEEEGESSATQKKKRKMGEFLVRKAINGELLEDEVMVITEENYMGRCSRNALVFQCSLCTYVGDRYYHAGMHSPPSFLVCCCCT